MSKAASFAVAFARDVLYFAAAQGHSLDSLCRKAGFARERLAQPDDMASGEEMDRVWQTACEATGDPSLGLHLGQAGHPSSLGLLGFAMLSSATIEEAIGKLVRYWNLLSNATHLELERRGGRATLRMELLDLPGNFLMRNRHPVECCLSAAIAILRALAGREVALIEVCCTYPEPPDVREYVGAFGGRPRFGAPVNAIVFDSAALAWPVAHANPVLVAALEDQIQRRLAASGNGTMGDRVRRELARRLRGEAPDLTSIAGSLTMSERALQRDLQQEGTTFRDVLDGLRRELAAEYLADPRHSITDVSFLLGFSEPSVLHRYFRRWFGCTPAEYRRKLA